MNAAVHVVDSSRSNYTKTDNRWLPSQGLSAYFRRLQKIKQAFTLFFHPLRSYLLQDFIHLCFPVSTLPLIGAGWRREEGLQVCWLTGGTGWLIQVRLHLRNLQYLTQLSVIHDLVKGIIHDQTCGTLSIIHAVCDAVILYCNKL